MIFIQNLRTTQFWITEFLRQYARYRNVHLCLLWHRDTERFPTETSCSGEAKFSQHQRISLGTVLEVPSIAILSLLSLHISLQPSRTSVCVKLNGHRAGFERHESELEAFILFFYTAKAEFNQDQNRSENRKQKKLISVWRNFGHCMKQDTYLWFGNKL